jgi:hypothetical protein
VIIITLIVVEIEIAEIGIIVVKVIIIVIKLILIPILVIILVVVFLMFIKMVLTNNDNHEKVVTGEIIVGVTEKYTVETGKDMHRGKGLEGIAGNEIEV